MCKIKETTTIIITMNSVHKPSNIFTDGESTCQREYSTQQMGQQESFGKTGSFGTNGACPFGSGHKDYNPFSQMAVVPTRSTQIQIESGENTSTEDYHNMPEDLKQLVSSGQNKTIIQIILQFISFANTYYIDFIQFHNICIPGLTRAHRENCE